MPKNEWKYGLADRDVDTVFEKDFLAYPIIFIPYNDVTSGDAFSVTSLYDIDYII